MTQMPQNFLPAKKSRIAVAMSGGVDSSVAAYLLAKAGHELVGLTAWTLNGPGKCCNDALVNAGRVCEMLDFPYDTVDLRAEFSHYVMDYYHNMYQSGLTPNPCVECNRYVKWEALVHYAVNELNVDYVATGHYARLDYADSSESDGSGCMPSGFSNARPSRINPGHARVYRGTDEHKDQTYMMTRVYPKDLSKTIFPLGDWVKPDVVRLAKEVGLPTAYSKESQDICFVLEGQANYMTRVLGTKTGPIVDLDTGKTLGEHDGHYLFTVGQRKGIKVAAGRPIYVIRTDPATNTVYVGDKEHLETTRFTVLSTNWLIPEPRFPLRSMVKIRYNTPASLGTVTPDPANPALLVVTLDAPQAAITPGQIAAFYDPTYSQLLGGGYIEQQLVQQPFDPTIDRELPDLHCQLTQNGI